MHGKVKSGIRLQLKEIESVEKFGLSKDESMERIIECASYGEAVRVAASSNQIVVFFAYGQWWF